MEIKALEVQDGDCMTSKEFLQQGWNIDKRIEKRIDERERLLAKLTNGVHAQLSDMPKSKNQSDWTDTALKIIELDNRLKNEINELIEIRNKIDKAISDVSDIKLRTLLEYRYRNCMSWEKIAVEMGYEFRHITRLHGTALKMVKVPEKMS